MEPITILAAGTDYFICGVQTACPSSLQMTLGLRATPSCRERSVPLDDRSEEEEEGACECTVQHLSPS